MTGLQMVVVGNEVGGKKVVAMLGSGCSQGADGAAAAVES